MNKVPMLVASWFAAASLTNGQTQVAPGATEGTAAIDWAQRCIVASGLGAPNPSLPQSFRQSAAAKAATVNALRNALEAVKGMAVNSSTTVEGLMTASDAARAQVNGYLNRFEQEGKTSLRPDSTVEVTVKIPIDGMGNLADQLYGKDIGDKPSVTEFDGKKAPKESAFSGLIVDCRSLKVKPALCPRVLDESGKVIYCCGHVSRAWAVKQGMAGYVKDPQTPGARDRVGGNPATVKAAKVAGGTDVVIPNGDAAEIRSATRNLTPLSECRVVLVVD